MGKKVTEVDLAAKEKELDDRFSRIETFQKDFESKGLEVLSGNGGPTIHTRSRVGSYEQKILSSFGCKGFNELLMVNSCDQKFNHVSYESKSAVQNLKEAYDIGRWISQMFHDQPLDGERRVAQVKNIFGSYYGKNVLEPLVKAFDSTVAGTGGNWVPTGMSNQFIAEFELEKKVATMFRELPMPTNPWELPTQGGRTTARKIAEGATISGSNFTTGKITFTATKLGEYYPIPTELDEDSAPAILALARTEIVEAQIRAREEIILNGDTTATHMDNDTAGLGADVAQKVQIGLRKKALVNSATITASSAVSKTVLDNMRNAMGKFSNNPRDMAYFFGPTGYNQAVTIDEVTTVEKYGPSATIHTGALAQYRGVPIITSEAVREDVAATGVNTLAGPNTTGVAYLTNVKRFYAGIRRPIQTRIAMSEPDDDLWKLASYQRWDFQGHVQSATEVSTVLAIDLTV